MKDLSTGTRLAIFLIILANSAGLIIALTTFNLIAKHEMLPVDKVRFFAAHADRAALQHIVLDADATLRGLLDALAMMTWLVFGITAVSLAAVFIAHFAQRHAQKLIAAKA